MGHHVLAYLPLAGLTKLLLIGILSIKQGQGKEAKNVEFPTKIFYRPLGLR